MTIKSTEQSRLAKTLLAEHPDWTHTQIGEVMGVGRERVRQLLLLEGISVREMRKLSRIQKEVCPVCGGRKKDTSKICNTCYRKLHNVKCVCETCGKEFVRYKSQVERDGGIEPRFCSRECQGVWLGTTYGFKGEKGGEMDQESGHQQDEQHERTVEAGKVD